MTTGKPEETILPFLSCRPQTKQGFFLVFFCVSNPHTMVPFLSSSLHYFFCILFILHIHKAKIKNKKQNKNKKLRCKLKHVLEKIKAKYQKKNLAKKTIIIHRKAIGRLVPTPTLFLSKRLSLFPTSYTKYILCPSLSSIYFFLPFFSHTFSTF